MDGKHTSVHSGLRGFIGRMKASSSCLTHGVGLAVLGRHHEGRFAQSVDGVHLGVVSEQQLETFHVVRVGCGV